LLLKKDPMTHAFSHSSSRKKGEATNQQKEAHSEQQKQREKPSHVRETQTDRRKQKQQQQQHSTRGSRNRKRAATHPKKQGRHMQAPHQVPRVAAVKAKQAQRRPHPGDVSLCTTTAEGALADTRRDSWALKIFLALDVVPRVLANLAVVCTALRPTVPMMQLSKPKNAPKGSRGQVPHLRSVCSVARC